MASRMERYYKNDSTIQGRSSKNKSLYDQIGNLDTYTNIEGVTTIEKTNEIDISKVRELIKNRENYKKQKELRGILEEEKEELEKEEEVIEEPKNYDVKDLLSKMKTEPKEDVKTRSLGEEQYEFLKTLNKKDKKYDIEQEEEQLKDLLNTIVNTKVISETPKAEDDVGLLDELKSDTMVGDASSIKKIIEEEKEKEIEETNTEIDKSFYTSSFGFTKKDFEELKNMNHNIKNSNEYIIILLVTVIALISIGGVIFFLIK